MRTRKRGSYRHPNMWTYDGPPVTLQPKLKRAHLRKKSFSKHRLWAISLESVWRRMRRVQAAEK